MWLFSWLKPRRKKLTAQLTEFWLDVTRLMGRITILEQQAKVQASQIARLDAKLELLRNEQHRPCIHNTGKVAE